MAEVTAKINKAGMTRFLNKTVQPYLEKKAREIAAEAVKAAPNATGELAQSISVRKAPRGGVEIQVTAPHAGFVHYGTGPQHQPTARPNYYPKLRRRGLILWAESKGANPHQVASGIAKNGTPANPFLQESIEKVLGKFQFKWITRDVGTAG